MARSKDGHRKAREAAEEARRRKESGAGEGEETVDRGGRQDEVPAGSAPFRCPDRAVGWAEHRNGGPGPAHASVGPASSRTGSATSPMTTPCFALISSAGTASRMAG